MKSKFNRLFNTIMEDINKSSKKTVIKESIGSREEYKQFITMCADIVKNAGDDAMQIFIRDSVNYDSSDTIGDQLYDNNVTLEQWENAVKYGWIVDSLPFAIAYDDDEFESAATPEQMKQIEEFVYGNDNNFTNCFFEAFLKGDTTDVDFCKQICEKLGVTDPDKEALMIDEVLNGEMAEESAKKPVSKRRVIKENKSTEWRKGHCMTVGQLKAELAKLDPNTEMKWDTPFADSVEGSDHIWEVDDEFAPDYATLQASSRERTLTAGELINKLSKFADNVYAAVYDNGCRWDGPEYIKTVKDNMIIGDNESFCYNWQGRRCTLEEAVKKSVSKRRVIKESAPVKRQVRHIRKAK